MIGRKSLAFFCEYYLQDVFRPKPDNNARELADYHFDTWKTLEKMFIEDDFEKLQMVMPRGSAKTTICSYALSIWTHVYKMSTYTLICGCTEADSTEFIKNVRLTLEENPYIKASFGELIDSKKNTVNSLVLELTNGTKIQGLSSASSPRGKKYKSSRPSLIILDDWINQGDILTQDARDKKWKIFTQDLGQVGDPAVWRDGKKIKPGTRQIVLGTLLHSDDLNSRLLKDVSFKHIIKKAAEIDNPDEYFNSGLWADFKKILFNPKDELAKENAQEFYYQHEKEMSFNTLWPDKYRPLELAMAFYSDSQAFKQELQNDVSKVGARAFHTLKTMSAKEIEDNDFKMTVLAVDPAVEVGKKNDYTAFAVASKTSNNFQWIRKGIIDKLTFDQYTKKVIEILEEYEDITYVWVEKNTYNGSDVREIKNLIAQHDTLKHRHIEIINERQSKNKENKIRALGGKVDSGFIIFNEDDTEFNDQVLMYEGEIYSIHDDAPDVVAEASRLLETLQPQVEKLRVFDLSILGL